MSWWTNFRDTAEKAVTLGMYDPVKSRHAESEARYAINDQIKAYKDQTELTKQQLNQTKNEEVAQKRRIEEKQIRALRRNYRSQGAGLLGVGAPASQDMSSNLGG